MEKTIGERLDDEWDFAWWTGRMVAAFTTLHAVSRARLLDHLKGGPNRPFPFARHPCVLGRFSQPADARNCPNSAGWDQLGADFDGRARIIGRRKCRREEPVKTECTHRAGELAVPDAYSDLEFASRWP
jgi:hypothetical protein